MSILQCLGRWITSPRKHTDPTKKKGVAEVVGRVGHGQKYNGTVDVIGVSETIQSLFTINTVHWVESRADITETDEV